MDDKQRQEALQALNLLDSVAAAVGGRQQIDTSRAAHFQYQQAVAVIRKTLTKEGALDNANVVDE